MGRIENDEFTDDPGDMPSRQHGASPDRYRHSEKVGAASAIIGGAFNVAYMIFVMAIPSLGFPFIGPAFANITLALIAGPAANIMSLFMRIGYTGRFTKHLGKFLESAAATWGFYSLWQNYPFTFTTVGLPAAIDKWLPVAFAVFAGISAISGLRHFLGLAGIGRWRRNRIRIEDNDLED